MFKKDVHYFKNQYVIQHLASEIASYEKHIQEDAIVLPLNYHPHWQNFHLSNYLGMQKPMVILENYEAGNSYFPLHWNEGWCPMVNLGTLKSGDACKNWQSNPYGNPIQPDFVFIYGKMPQDSCSKRIELELKNHFISIQETENCQLFKKK